ncbi:MAG TPA: phospholipase D-like domain-containing protein [Polyangiaceae bacterium]|nr:phospholipase D-like domain-containing protein [Polyangiaceae bacterium]
MRGVARATFCAALACALASCGEPVPPPAPPPAPGTAPVVPPAARARARARDCELVESWPVETRLDHADIPDAASVWIAMIDGARETLEIAEFYLSDAPPSARPSALTKVVAAIQRAAARGVRVRVLVEDAFYAKYPELPDALAATPGVALRRAEGKRLYGGGILHAKYFVVDGRDAYVGSQNFDYRSLEHIHELGLRTRDASVVTRLVATFRRDFRAAGGDAPLPPPLAPEPANAAVHFAASPRDALPEGVAWDLPLLEARLDGARREVLVQALGYKAAMRDGAPFVALDAALRRALARGVRVTLQVGHWHGKEPSLLALREAGATVRVLEVPRWSGGDVPFARVIHAKYMVVDGERAWLGTSNWEGDYFLKSRNVSVFIDDASFAKRLARVFADVAEALPEAR